MSSNPDDVIKWPCGTWCYRSELSEFNFMSDDFEIIRAETANWHAFIQTNGA